MFREGERKRVNDNLLFERNLVSPRPSTTSFIIVSIVNRLLCRLQVDYCVDYTEQSVS